MTLLTSTPVVGPQQREASCGAARRVLRRAVAWLEAARARTARTANDRRQPDRPDAGHGGNHRDGTDDLADAGAQVNAKSMSPFLNFVRVDWRRSSPSSPAMV
jgi:hypothetical protein